MKFLATAFLLGLLSNTSFSAPGRLSGTLTCKADLRGSPSTLLHVSATSKPFKLGGMDLSEGNVAVEFGDYTLRAHMDVSSSGPFPPKVGEEFQPTLHMNLYEDGNPLQGSINYVAARGLALDKRPTDVPLRLIGIAFIDTTHQGKKISRADYGCELIVSRR